MAAGLGLHRQACGCGSRARAEARPDSDLDPLVILPQATLTPQERQQTWRSLRAEVVLVANAAERDAGQTRGVRFDRLRPVQHLHQFPSAKVLQRG